jgi:hypothetical protein
VGVRAAPAHPHIPTLFSRLTFFQWSQPIIIEMKVIKFMLSTSLIYAGLLQYFPILTNCFTTDPWSMKEAEGFENCAKGEFCVTQNTSKRTSRVLRRSEAHRRE